MKFQNATIKITTTLKPKQKQKQKRSAKRVALALTLQEPNEVVISNEACEQTNDVSALAAALR